MIRDALAVAWKEWREMPYQIGQGHARSGWSLLAVYLTLFGVVYPAEQGLAYLQSFTAVFIPCFAAIFTLSAAADSFAGERERHTLDALLATRLTDRGLLAGKILAPMLVGWTGAMAQIFLAWIVAVAAGHRLAFYSGAIFWSAVASTFSLAFFGGTIGVLVSLRAESVRQAVQSATLALFVIAVVPGVLLRSVAPVHRWVASQPPSTVVLLADAVLVICGLASSMLAALRCRRVMLAL